MRSNRDMGQAVGSGRSSDRLMQTFRMPRDLVAFLKQEAVHGRRDLTAQVLRYLEGIRSSFGLPDAASELLERDRQRLGMERFEYLVHVLYQRSLELRQRGVGFDAPAGAQDSHEASEGSAQLP